MLNFRRKRAWWSEKVGGKGGLIGTEQPWLLPARIPAPDWVNNGDLCFKLFAWVLTGMKYCVNHNSLFNDFKLTTKGKVFKTIWRKSFSIFCKRRATPQFCHSSFPAQRKITRLILFAFPPTADKRLWPY